MNENKVQIEAYWYRPTSGGRKVYKWYYNVWWNQGPKKTKRAALMDFLDYAKAVAKEARRIKKEMRR